MTAPAHGPRPTGRRRLRRTRRRLVALVGLTWLRAVFAVLQVVAPAAAGRKAVDVWCTLPPGAGARRHDHRPYPGDVIRLAVGPERGGGVVTAEVWGEGPVVYLVHGWGGWRGQLGALVAPLVEAGHRVVAVDAPGHGDADPGMLGRGRGTVVEMIDALGAVAREFGPASGVVAHSLGTTVAARAVQDGLMTRRLVLIAPNPSFTALLEHFARMLRLGDRVTAHLRTAIEDIAHRPIGDFDLTPIGADGSMPDTLVLHDRRDVEAPHAVGEAVAAAWPNARLISTDGFGHYRILGAPQVTSAAVEHLTAEQPAPDRA